MPPLELRRLVGRVDPEDYDNPSGDLVYPYLDEALYARFFDFGCGCGRVARQLIQQRTRPERYLGIDLHEGMVRWCRENLEPRAPGFEFRHHDVFNPMLNPGRGKPMTAPLPAPDHSFSLVNAWSVFTHLTQEQAEFYLREVARILEPGGVLHSTWFLTDKRLHPFMLEHQNALYINLEDPSNAVIFDRDWMRATSAAAGLTAISVTPPEFRGYHWYVTMTPTREGIVEADFPPDEAPLSPGQHL
jgi:SAM-dependent methyltransferase